MRYIMVGGKVDGNGWMMGEPSQLASKRRCANSILACGEGEDSDEDRAV